jgi:hypothetical protein
MWSSQQHGTLKVSASEARPVARHREGLAYRDPLTPFQLFQVDLILLLNTLI